MPSADAKVPVWQLAHCAVTGTCVWLKRLGFQLLVLWQAAQLVLPTGTWLLGLPAAPLLPPPPLWQVPQAVAALKVLWSTRAPDQLLVDRWQLSQLVCPACTVVLGLLPLWQVLHWAVTLTLLCSLAGVQLLKPLRWQLSQVVDARLATCV